MAPPTHPPQWVHKYRKDIRAFGVLPPDWKAANNPAALVYIGPNNVASDHHPLSPEGRKAQNNLKYCNDNRLTFNGIPQPPYMYSPNTMNFVLHDCANDALVKALANSGVSVTTHQITEDLAYFQKNHNKIFDEPYHPADKDLILTNFEPYISEIARKYDRNVNIVGVRVETAGQWNHIWDGIVPPVFLRWGSGLQDDRKPIFLGILPDYNRFNEKLGIYYTIEPTTGLEEQWNNIWRASSWMPLYRSCGFPQSLTFDDFCWVMVACQRSIAWGCSIAGADIGEWVIQYGEHIEINLGHYDHYQFQRKNRRGKPFRFDATLPKRWAGPILMYNVLSAKIQVAEPGTATRMFAAQWDNAAAKWYEYKAARDLNGGAVEFDEAMALFEHVSALSKSA